VPTFAANPAGLPLVSLSTVERANQILPKRNDGGGRHLSCGGYAWSNCASVANFRSECPDENFARERVCRYVSRLLLGHNFGAFPAPGGTRSSASYLAPFLGLGSPETSLRTTAKSASQISFGEKADRRHLGAGPTRQAPPTVTRATMGEFTNGDTIMYQNKATLIGFLGSNPQVRTGKDRSFTTLSLATKSFYKKDDKYISHTEWHRCVVFGKLSEFAKTLTKGAHIQVEGELRSREYDSKKTDSKLRVWEIRVVSILKLDRAEKAAAEDQEGDDAPEEETAA